MWTDESPFVARFHGRRRVWRLHNERFNPLTTQATIKHDIKINVWGAFSLHGIGIIEEIKGIMDKEMYLDILENAMILSADMLYGREDWQLQQDNDPKHTARVVKAWMTHNNVPLLPWPAQSPDLNPIENLWSILDASCKDRKCNMASKLFAILRDAWGTLDKSLLESLVNSMHDRCQAVIEAKGGASGY